MFDIRQKISARLKASRAQTPWTYEETAKHLGGVMGEKIGPSRYGNWELGINVPPYEMVIGMAKIFNKPAAWLAGLSDDDGTAPETSGYLIPPLSTVPSASGIQDLGDSSFAFHRNFLEANRLDPKQILLLIAPDDSMTGKIEKGDRILVDLSDTVVHADDLFAIMVSGRPRLRWIRQNLQGNYIIQAERREYYSDEVITVEELKKLHILGRVRMIAQLR